MTIGQPGMGALPHAQGTTFRVWAPHADAVCVKGSFNDWSDDAHPLVHEGDGFWAADVAGVEAGAQYKFGLRRGDSRFDRIDPQARQVTNSVGVGVVYDRAAFDWQGVEAPVFGHHELVIYEMHVGTLNAAPQGGPGRFELALQRLDHLKELGVNAIQVMPVAEFAGDYSWGVYAVESAYGGPDAFKTFVREVHRAGMIVILDVVYNHFGPSDLDLWQFDGWSENDRGGIYFYNDHRAETPWGATRPDYGRPEVRQFIRDNAMMWLEEFRVDGLRMDMTLYIRTIGGGVGEDLPDGWSLMQDINREIRLRFPHAISISEDLRSNDAITASDLEGGACFHAQWDARFVHPVRAAVITPDDADRSMAALRDAVLHRYNGDAFRRVIYSESHDEVANGKARVPEEIGGGNATGWFAQKRSTLAAALVFCAPGIPMLFQGQEFLEGAWFRDDVPLDWHHRDDFSGIVRLYRDLVRLRLNRDGISRGLSGHHVQVTHEHEDHHLLVFQRFDQHGPGDDVMVVVNLSQQARDDLEIGLPCAGLWRVRFNSDATTYSALFGNHPCADIEAVPGERDGLAASGRLSIGPYSVVVLSQQA